MAAAQLKGRRRIGALVFLESSTAASSKLEVESHLLEMPPKGTLCERMTLGKVSQLFLAWRVQQTDAPIRERNSWRLG